MGAKFPLTVLLVSVSVPELLIPPPEMARMKPITTTPEAFPLRMVIFERVTWVPLEIVTTVAVPPPSIIVVAAPEPRMVKFFPMARFSA